MSNICQFCTKPKDILIDLNVSYWNRISNKEILKFCIPELVYLQVITSIHICQTCHQRLAAFYLFKKSCIRNCLTTNEKQLQSIKKIQINNETNTPAEFELITFENESQIDSNNIVYFNLNNINFIEKKDENTEDKTKDISVIDTYDNANEYLNCDSFINLNDNQIKIEKINNYNDLTHGQSFQFENIDCKIDEINNIAKHNYEIKEIYNSDILKNIKSENKLNDVGINLDGITVETRENSELINSDGVIDEFIKRIRIENGDVIKEEEDIINNDIHFLSNVNISDEMKNLIIESLKNENPTCPYCEKTFTNKLYYKKRHIFFHILNVDVECSICKKLVKKQHLEEHQRLHKEETHYKCTMCSDSFKTRRQRYYHKKMVHLTTILCPICKKKCKNESDMKQHLRIHNNDRPYTCPICNKSFTSYSYLRRHNVVHDENISFKCPTCSKEFKRNDDLKRHLYRHENTEYPCSNCNKIFTNKLSFKDHLACHKQKDHNCSICSKTFARRDYLNKHMLTHKNEKPHKCSECSSSFKRKDCLKLHIKRKHNNTLNT